MPGTYMVDMSSDDGLLCGDIECVATSISISYIVRLYKTRPQWNTIDIKVFGNGVDAEDFLIAKLECPLFTLLGRI